MTIIDIKDFYKKTSKERNQNRILKILKLSTMSLDALIMPFGFTRQIKKCLSAQDNLKKDQDPLEQIKTYCDNQQLILKAKLLDFGKLSTYAFLGGWYGQDIIDYSKKIIDYFS